MPMTDRLEELLKKSEGFMGMSKIQQMDWLKELQQQAAQAIVYMRLTNEKLDTSIELDRQNYFGSTTPEPEYNGSSSGGGGSSGVGSNNGGNTQTQPTYYYASSAKSGSIPGFSSLEKTESQARQSVINLINSQFEYLKQQILNGSGTSSEKMEKIRALSNSKDAAIGGITISPRYKTGGLADFTGPAWLDGTKSRP